MAKKKDGLATPKPLGVGGFQKRLLRAQRKANFTVADLARWFARPHPTVRCWTQGTRPSGGPLDSERVERGLARMEALVKNKKLPLCWMPPRQKIKALRLLARR